MEEDITGVGETSKPDEPTVVINNREVPVSMAPEVLKQMEHDLKSGYDRKLIEERQSTKARLEADKTFYATHPPEAWEQYEPTVDGGRGWIGQGDPATVQANVTHKEQVMAEPTGQQANSPFAEAELTALKTKQTEMERRLYEQDVSRSISTRNALAAKYPLADLASVTGQMKAWDLEHGLQACPDDVVEQIMSQSHTFVNQHVEKVKATMTVSASAAVNTATPSLAGATPSGAGKAVAPSFNDVDAMANFIADQIS